jgi:DNA-binding NarL/FixJ family response regulator
MKVAVIDDDPIQLKLFEKIFRRTFHRDEDDVETFHFPRRQEELFLKRNHFDFILVDYDLGGTNGADYAKRLFANNFEGRIIVISASETTDLTRCTYYFNKSDIFKNPHLLATVPNDEIRQAVEMTYLSTRQTGFRASQC